MPVAELSSMTVKFWGTRGSIPTPGASTVRYGGNTACVEVQWGEGRRLIFDAGSGIRLLGESLCANDDSPQRLDIFLSHLHWDHIQGLPFFIPLYRIGMEVHLWGFNDNEITLERMLDHQLHSAFFPIGRKELAADIQFHHIDCGSFELGDAVVTVRHCGKVLAFKLECDSRSFVYATDREPDPPDLAGIMDRELINLARNADLLVHDAQYTDEEYTLFRRGWGHSSFSEARRIGRLAQVKKLVTFHHDPSHEDTMLAEMESKLREEERQLSRVEVSIAAENQTIRI
jgi:phosphoribosyl 1,2-cyclic phosphodiesterase